ncbi:hypothetical protein K2X33_00305 [bacterium]|nr:hypothetical protein [bacterium]
MDVRPPESAWRTALRPWFLILLTAPLLLSIVGVTVYRWQTHRQENARLSDTFAERQNRVLQHDARRVARAVTNLLALAASDARLVSVLPPDGAGYARFFEALRVAPPAGVAPGESIFPLYNRLLIWRDSGRFQYFHAGDKAARISSVDGCTARDLCDRATLELGKRASQGRAIVGKALRWYTPEKSPGAPGDGTLSVAYRFAGGVVLLGIDYRSFESIVRLPTFPYQERGNLLQDYEAGNYIYLLDADTDLLAHPKPWHLYGLDYATGEPRPPMKSDSDAGTHPLNFRAYERGILRPYFDRLIQRTFQAAEVDIFEAANMSGLIRVVSVAPIYLDPAFFDQQGPFGYAGVGCALEHFREPQERPVPYY